MNNEFSVGIFNKVDEEWWNSLIKSAPEGTIFQTTYWADYLKKWISAEPLYLVIKNRNREVVGMLLAFKEANLIYHCAGKRFLFPAIWFLKKILPVSTFHEGPLILTSQNQPEILQTLLFALQKVSGISKNFWEFSG